MEQLFDVLFVVLGLVGISAIVALSEHPQLDAGFWPIFLRVLGRLSLRRFRDAPGRWHLPGTRQPWPEPQVPGRFRPPPPPDPPAGAGAVVLLLFLLVGGCNAGLVRARYVTAQGLREQVQLAQELRAFSLAEEGRVLSTSKTQEEARGKLAHLRPAVDLALKLLERGHAALQDVARALGEPAASAGDAAGGVR